MGVVWYNKNLTILQIASNKYNVSLMYKHYATITALGPGWNLYRSKNGFILRFILHPKTLGIFFIFRFGPANNKKGPF